MAARFEPVRQLPSFTSLREGIADQMPAAGTTGGAVLLKSGLDLPNDLLLGVTSAIQVLLEEHNLSAAMTGALEIVRASLDLDRLYVCEHHACEHYVCKHQATQDQPPCQFANEGLDELPWFDLRCEALNTTGSLRSPQSLPEPSLETAGWQEQRYMRVGLAPLYERLILGHPFGGLTTELGDPAQYFFLQQGIAATWIVPIVVDQQLWGFLGAEAWHPRLWSEADRWGLDTLAAGLAAALQRQRAEQRLSYQAFHDALTGLPNRLLFYDRLPTAIAHARRSNAMLAVIFLDVDHFKTINDTLGHDVGDRLLLGVVERLAEGLREEDTLARWGGDEFTLCLPDLKSSEDVAKVCQRLLDMLAEPFDLAGQTVQISCSMGIALCPQDGGEIHTLLRHADEALYRVKAAGRGHYQFYQSETTTETQLRLSWEQQLHQALENQAFVLYYEPRHCLKTGQILGLAALLYWQHPQAGLLPLEQFLALAEASGLAIALGEWMLQTVCQQWQQWQLPRQTLGHRQNLDLSLTIFPQQWTQPNGLACVAPALQVSGMAAEQLELGLSETLLSQGLGLAEPGLERRSPLQFCQDLGVNLGLDNVGTGLLRLEALKQSPLRTIKLAPSLLTQEQAGDRALLEGIGCLAKAFGWQLVAKGVETEAQWELARSVGCTAAQGSFVGRPLRAEEVPGYLARL